MDAQHQEWLKDIKVAHYKPEEVPWRRLGQYLWRPIEDGSNTQFRLSMIESLVPPHSDGPVFHFHEMHDEGFYVTKGTVCFHILGKPPLMVKAGEMVMVPVRVPHKFSNPTDEEAAFINTCTPGFYFRYFEHLENMVGEGKELTREINMEAMRRFGTIPLTPQQVDEFECMVGVKSGIY